MSPPTTVQSLRGLGPFVRPYRWQVWVAVFFLLMAAAATLAFPWALRRLIDEGLSASATGDVLSQGFVQLFFVAMALAVFSAARYYTVSWLGETSPQMCVSRFMPMSFAKAPPFLRPRMRAKCCRV